MAADFKSAGTPSGLPHLAENTIFRKNYILKNTIFLENYIIDLKYNVELPHGFKGDSLIQHSTFNTQHSINHSTFLK